MATTPHELHALLTEARSRMVAVVPPDQPGMEIEIEVCRVCGGPNGHAPGCVVAVIEELIERIAPVAPQPDQEPKPAAIPGLRMMPHAYGLPADFEVVEVGTTEKYKALQAATLTPATFTRLVDWLREDPPRSAARAFTAGIERQIGYALELDVIPELKRLRAAAAADKARIEGLQASAQQAVPVNVEGPADHAPNPAPGLEFDERGVLVRKVTP